MTHRHYRSIGGLEMGVVLLLIVGIGVWKIEPVWWAEALVVSCGWLGSLFIWRWLTGSRKWGWVIASGMWGMLVLNRVDWLNGISLGLMLVFLGLISLIN